MFQMRTYQPTATGSDRSSRKTCKTNGRIRWGVLAVLFFTLPAAAAPSFQGIGLVEGISATYPRAVSEDGSVVTGQSFRGAFRWTPAGGLELLPRIPDGPSISAWGISADGQTVVGYAQPDEDKPYIAARVMAGRGVELLGGMDEFGPRMGVANDVSRKGTVVVGQAAGGLASRWTAAGGVQLLRGRGGLPFKHSEAFGVTPNGRVVVGQIFRWQATEAFRWVEGRGLERLGDLPGGGGHSIAEDVSANGHVVVGSGWSSRGRVEAFRWVEGRGMEALGDLPGGEYVSEALAVSGNGRTVVGLSKRERGDVAFIWDREHGMRELRDVLVEDYGLQQARRWDLVAAWDISLDGNTIVGWGFNPRGQAEGFVATLGQSTAGLSPYGLRSAVSVPEPGMVMWLGMASLALMQRTRRAATVS